MRSITITFHFLSEQWITITFHFWSVQSITITQKTVIDYDYPMSVDMSVFWHRIALLFFVIVNSQMGKFGEFPLILERMWNCFCVSLDAKVITSFVGGVCAYACVNKSQVCFDSVTLLKAKCKSRSCDQDGFGSNLFSAFLPNLGNSTNLSIWLFSKNCKAILSQNRHI